MFQCITHHLIVIPFLQVPPVTPSAVWHPTVPVLTGMEFIFLTAPVALCFRFVMKTQRAAVVIAEQWWRSSKAFSASYPARRLGVGNKLGGGTARTLQLQ